MLPRFALVAAAATAAAAAAAPAPPLPPTARVGAELLGNTPTPPANGTAPPCAYFFESTAATCDAAAGGGVALADANACSTAYRAVAGPSGPSPADMRVIAEGDTGFFPAGCFAMSGLLYLNPWADAGTLENCADAVDAKCLCGRVDCSMGTAAPAVPESTTAPVQVHETAAPHASGGTPVPHGGLAPHATPLPPHSGGHGGGGGAAHNMSSAPANATADVERTRLAGDLLGDAGTFVGAFAIVAGVATASPVAPSIAMLAVAFDSECSVGNVSPTLPVILHPTQLLGFESVGGRREAAVILGNLAILGVLAVPSVIVIGCTKLLNEHGATKLTWLQMQGKLRFPSCLIVVAALLYPGTMWSAGRLFFSFDDKKYQPLGVMMLLIGVALPLWLTWHVLNSIPRLAMFVPDATPQELCGRPAVAVLGNGEWKSVYPTNPWTRRYRVMVHFYAERYPWALLLEFLHMLLIAMLSVPRQIEEKNCGLMKICMLVVTLLVLGFKLCVPLYLRLRDKVFDLVRLVLFSIGLLFMFVGLSSGEGDHWAFTLAGVLANLVMVVVVVHLSTDILTRVIRGRASDYAVLAANMARSKGHSVKEAVSGCLDVAGSNLANGSGGDGGGGSSIINGGGVASNSADHDVSYVQMQQAMAGFEGDDFKERELTALHSTQGLGASDNRSMTPGAGGVMSAPLLEDDSELTTMAPLDVRSHAVQSRNSTADLGTSPMLSLARHPSTVSCHSRGSGASSGGGGGAGDRVSHHASPLRTRQRSLTSGPSQQPAFSRHRSHDGVDVVASPYARDEAERRRASPLVPTHWQALASSGDVRVAGGRSPDGRVPAPKRSRQLPQRMGSSEGNRLMVSIKASDAAGGRDSRKSSTQSFLNV